MLRILLRVLLCLVLVLNGSGYAFAATQMPLMHLADATAQPHGSADAHATHAMPCHDAAQDHAATATPAAHADCPAPSPHEDASDCCQSSQCSCDCLQHAASVVTAHQPPQHIPSSSRLAQPMKAGHVPPRLADLLRPPIA